MRFSILSLLVVTFVIAGGFALTRPKPNKWESMSVKAAVERLETTIQKYEPEFKFTAQPLPAAQIAKLKRELPDAPQQFFELLEISDYQSSKLFSIWETVPYDELKDASEKTQARYNSLGFGWEGWHGTNSPCCQADKFWRDKWLPIGDVNGNEVFIDMDPTEDGIPGQIVIVQTDGWYMSLMGYSIAHWLHRIADQIEADGQYARSAFIHQPMPPVR